MTKLEDLLHSLGTVIVRYYFKSGKEKIKLSKDDDVNKVLLQKSRDRAIKILQSGEYYAEFEKLIKACTEGYVLRSPFLTFILHEISYLKSLLERKHSFSTVDASPDSPCELKIYKQQMKQLFVDFQHLLTTAKSKSYDVTYTSIGNETRGKVSIMGLKSDAWVGPYLCASGQYLTAAVLEEFHLSAEKLNIEQINILVENICSEHQGTLLIPELLEENKRLVKLTDIQKQKIEEMEPKLKQASIKNEELQATIQLLDSQLKSTPSSPSQTELESKLAFLTEELKKSDKQVKELKDAFQKQKETIKIPSKPPGYGISSFTLFAKLSLDAHRNGAQRTQQVLPIEEVPTLNLTNE